MTKVDPYLFPKIPKAFESDPEVRIWWNYTAKFLHDLYLRTGGSSDSIADQTINELFPWQDTEEDESFCVSKFGDEQRQKEIIEISSDYTTTGLEDIIIANAAVTISLNPNPDEHELVNIKKTTKSLVIDGNGKNIDGASKAIPTINYTMIPVVYSAVSDEWYIV